MKKIFIASDHAGFEQKKLIINHLKKNNYEVIDLGTNSSDSVDYPDYGKKLGEEVVKHNTFGIALCGSGIGINIAANKVHGIRAALVYEENLARLSREHDDANILSLAARFTSNEKALKIVDAFLNSEFEGGRHKKRVDKLNSY